MGNLDGVYSDPTLVAMKQKIELLEAEKPSRGYLGASSIGDDCDRKLYFQYTNAPSEPISWQGCFAIEDGHRTEDLIAERLRLVDGIELVTHKPDGSQYGFSDLDGKFKGHVDGFIRGLPQAPSTTHIWENKCVAEKNFKKFNDCVAKHGEKAALEAWNYTYYVQAVLYMDYFNKTRHYMTVALSGGRDIASCRTEANPALAKAMRERAKRIVEATSAPVRLSEDRDYYLCKFCSYREFCHAAS